MSEIVVDVDHSATVGATTTQTGEGRPDRRSRPDRRCRYLLQRRDARRRRSRRLLRIATVEFGSAQPTDHARSRSPTFALSPEAWAEPDWSALRVRALSLAVRSGQFPQGRSRV